MYSIKIEAYFSAAHNLRGYKGKCEALHGHNWKVEVAVARENPDKAGMVVDFRLLKNELHKILEKLDHKYLNNITYFKKINPTSENLAKYVYDRIKLHTPDIRSVTVWESENSSATYYE
ncbi:MAG: 6-carboxytetrahydropterin synthase QueD [Candidatus Omnitrophica bacterium]|nr:6-carboxytetrahydropterin synthase QueD [Candidatus Omnitrophota bacterium]